MVESNSEWIIELGACKHFCSNKSLFAELEESNNGGVVYMGNASSAPIQEKGKILLKLNSGKILSLSDVLFVPSLRMNLISAGLLIKVGLKIVLEADKLVITKNGIFVGKGYLSGGLFVVDSTAMINDNAGLSYLVESLNIWHGRLGHLNQNSLKLMRKKDLLPSLKFDNSLPKCLVCAESKFFHKKFHIVSKRESGLLDLIHSDLADFKTLESRGGKRYHITFVD
ncbi:Retrovirus-related Pol polyprotein from transposon TNT 1-94 [Linum grandiflorum]